MALPPAAGRAEDVGGGVRGLVGPADEERAWHGRACRIDNPHYIL
jgi:hypothetical protein